METIAQRQTRFTVTRWQGSVAVFVAGLAGLFVLFWPTFAAMERTWRNSDTFQHTYIIPFVLAYLVWENRTRLAEIEPSPSLWGVAAIVLASGGWLVGEAADVLLIRELGVIGMVQGLILAIFGWTVVRVLIFPIAFMVFLVPMGEFLVPTLQKWTADFSVWFLELLGMHVTTDGLLIYVDGGVTDYSRFHVAKECSGIRYLMAMLQVGLLVAYLFFNRWPRRFAAVAFALIIPVVANWFRAVGIILLVYFTEGEQGKDVDHLIYGFWFFFLVLLIYLGICWFLADPLDPEPEAVTFSATKVTSAGLLMLLVTGAVAVTASAAGPLYARWTEPVIETGSLALIPPPATQGWRASDFSGVDWSPVFKGPDAELEQRYVKGPNHLDLFVGYYTHQRDGAELINAGNDLAGELWDARGTRSAELTIDGQAISVPVRRIEHMIETGWGARRKRAVAYWYWVDGRIVTSEQVAKLHAASARLLDGDQSSAVVAIAVDYEEDFKDVMPTIQMFIDEIDPMKTVKGVSAP